MTAPALATFGDAKKIEMILCQAVPSLPRQVQPHITVAGIIAKNVANVNKPFV
jgi:hypothetical protein